MLISERMEGKWVKFVGQIELREKRFFFLRREDLNVFIKWGDGVRGKADIVGEKKELTEDSTGGWGF